MSILKESRIVIGTREISNANISKARYNETKYSEIGEIDAKRTNTASNSPRCIF